MYRNGIVLGLITAIISGFSIFSNSLFVTKTDPLIFVLVRNVFVAVLLTVVIFATKKLEEVFHLTRKQWFHLVLIGAIGGGIPFALFFTGLAQIGAVNGNILNKTLFLWVALLAVPILHERIRALQIIGYLVLFIGMFLVGGTFTFLPVAGSWLVILATMLWAVEYLISKRILTSISPAVVGWGRILFGLPFLLAASMGLGNTHLLVNRATYAFFPIFVSSVFLVCFIMSWYSALKAAPATLVSAILVIAPVVTAFLAYWIQGKAIATTQLISFGFLIFGVGLVSSIAVRFIRQESTAYDG